MSHRLLSPNGHMNMPPASSVSAGAVVCSPAYCYTHVIVHHIEPTTPIYGSLLSPLIIRIILFEWFVGIATGPPLPRRKASQNAQTYIVRLKVVVDNTPYMSLSPHAATPHHNILICSNQTWSSAINTGILLCPKRLSPVSWDYAQTPPPVICLSLVHIFVYIRLTYMAYCSP